MIYAKRVSDKNNDGLIWIQNESKKSNIPRSNKRKSLASFFQSLKIVPYLQNQNITVTMILT